MPGEGFKAEAAVLHSRYDRAGAASIVPGLQTTLDSRRRGDDGGGWSTVSVSTLLKATQEFGRGASPSCNSAQPFNGEEQWIPRYECCWSTIMQSFGVA